MSQSDESVPALKRQNAMPTDVINISFDEEEVDKKVYVQIEKVIQEQQCKNCTSSQQQQQNSENK